MSTNRQSRPLDFTWRVIPVSVCRLQTERAGQGGRALDGLWGVLRVFFWDVDERGFIGIGFIW